MKIHSIQLENFRSFKNQLVTIDDYSCFVGPNGAGKSTILSALNIFFQNVTSSTPNVRELDEEDFNNKNTALPIRITLIFNELSESAKSDLSDYVRQDKLVVAAEAHWDNVRRFATVRQHGHRLGMKVFAEEYFSKESDGMKVADLKIIFASLRNNFPEIAAAATGPKMIESLQKYEADHPELCELIPSDDEFYGANSGKLNKFIQWVYVPAVKDAQEEGEESKKGALGILLGRTVRAKTNFSEQLAALRKEIFDKFELLLSSNQQALEEISAKLKARLAEWSHIDTNLDLRWLSDPAKSVQVNEPIAGVYTGEGEFTGRLARMGHGLQRSYLLALLTELASLDTENAPTLLLGCEEPELYQHPPQARRLADVFRSLTEKNTQVLITTHSPYFVSGKNFEDIHIIRKSASNTGSTLSHTSTADFNSFLLGHSKNKERTTPAGLRAKIGQSLQPHLNEMFFCRHPVFVEGLEDVAYITTALHLFGHWDEFHSMGCHLIPSNGKNHLIHPVALSTKLGLPYYLVFDCDSDARDEDLSKHEPDNNTLFSLVGAPPDDPFPKIGYRSSICTAWATNMGSSISSDFSSDAIEKHTQIARKVCGQAKSLDKNSMFIAEWLTSAHEDGHKSASLEMLCKEIIASAAASA